MTNKKFITKITFQKKKKKKTKKKTKKMFIQ